jgi:dihydropteroate synthase
MVPHTDGVLPWGSRTFVMGVLNLTPDSFSDGGTLRSADQAARRAAVLSAQGADILDLGGQSTRPGASDVPAAVEIDRVLPALGLIRQQLIRQSQDGSSRGGDPAGSAGPLLSIDTFRASVAEAALEAGADWINDVSGGRRDPRMLAVVARAGCPFVLMHSRGDSRRMDGLAVYDDVVGEVRDELLRSTDAALAAGIEAGKVIWDPGLGFAKSGTQNLALLRGLAVLRAEGFPLLIGPSRKRFIGEVLGEPRPRARLWGTAAVCSQAVAAGADVVRVHDVGPAVQIVRMTDALVRHGNCNGNGRDIDNAEGIR